MKPKTVAPTPITQAEFLALTVNLPGSIPSLHEEREWWMSGGRLGVIVRDKFDNDWGWIALARNPHNSFQAYNFQVSLPTSDQARASLTTALEANLKDGWWK